jgi:transposase-like protein
MATENILAPHFTDVDKAREYLERLRWPNGTVCPHCGMIGDHYKLQGKATRPGLWKCKESGCRKQFTVIIGTVFSDSKIPLSKWLLAVHLMCASKKAISSHQLHRMLGVTYKSAWFMTHRIRKAMSTTGSGLLGSGGGTVEADETHWGNNGKKARTARGYQHKMKVVSLVERGGEKRSIAVSNVNAKILKSVLNEHVSKKARLMTDERSAYTKVGREYAKHGVTVHSRGEYARGDFPSNTVESSFSLLKRGLVGTVHHVGEQHL